MTSVLKVATFNANSIRSRLGLVLTWLEQETPDILCLQETKVQDEDFPAQPIRDTGYHVVFRGQKAYGGVAIISVDFHPEACAALERLRDWGFVDVFRLHHPGEPQQYTFWDYRARNPVERGIGWRVDHIWATESLARRSTRAWIDVAARLVERPSDHTFLIAEFVLERQ